jgi:acetyltransferase-like isoleucine patch superfamily enzyme
MRLEKSHAMRILKTFLWRVFDGLALVISYRHGWGLVKYLTLLNNRGYSFALMRRFKNAGRNMFIEYPAVILGAEYITIGENFEARARLRLQAFGEHMYNRYTPEVCIGRNVRMNYDCHIGCVNRIVIGDNVLMGSSILITDHLHGEISAAMLKLPPEKRKVVSRGPVIIEENVWIGEGVAIMPNVRIGRNTIVGANAVVTHDLPPNCVAGGVPARVIRYLSVEKT